MEGARWRGRQGRGDEGREGGTEERGRGSLRERREGRHALTLSGQWYVP
jgi:hypothetical protein